MNTEAKLKSLCAVADDALDIVNRRTRELFTLLADDARQFRFEFTPRHGELIADITRYGRVADSAAFVDEKVLAPADAYIIDIELNGVSRTIGRLTDEIEQALHE